MPELLSIRTRRWLTALLGGALLLALLTACFRAYLRPDFLLEMISSNLMC
jgi:hypothetical protein